jgi:hypothetical protein
MQTHDLQTKPERYAARRKRYEIGAGAVGALGGAGLGALAAGPPGAVVGAVIGAGVGAITAWANHTGTEVAAERDSQLDVEIGVTDGDIGAPGLEHPPAEIGAFSREASGAGGASTETKEAAGPILRPPD